MFFRDHSCVQFSVAIFSYNLQISLLKFLHCIIAVWYGNRFKSVRIATDILTLWTITTNLSWQYHLNDISIKLNRANALLFKMRKYVSLKILRSIYFAIFDSYLSYCCLVWAQNCSTIQRIVILQKKAVRIINFQPRNSHTSHLFKRSSILKFQDKICLENIFIYQQIFK